MGLKEQAKMWKIRKTRVKAKSRQQIYTEYILRAKEWHRKEAEIWGEREVKHQY